jgi:CheY-like chemotaxis protein
MTKVVLDVGNCNPDHAALASMLKRNYGAEVLRADQLQDTLELLQKRSVDLILINRKLDIDYSDGIEILRVLKRTPELDAIPVMLITNYPEHQQQAVAEGAVLGFGKLELSTPETRQKLVPFLNASPVQG